MLRDRLWINTHTHTQTRQQKLLCRADVIYNGSKLSSIRTLSLHKVKTPTSTSTRPLTHVLQTAGGSIVTAFLPSTHCTKLSSLWIRVWHTSHKRAPAKVLTSRLLASILPWVPLSGMKWIKGNFRHPPALVLNERQRCSVHTHLNDLFM